MWYLPTWLSSKALAEAPNPISIGYVRSSINRKQARAKDCDYVHTVDMIEYVKIWCKEYNWTTISF
jgi:hypothetical protein